MEKHGKTRKPAGVTATGGDVPPSTRQARAYAFGAFVIDLDSTRVLRGTTVLPLPSRAFDALVYLVENRDRLVGKEELISTIWNNVAVTDDSLIHAVSVLRRTLGDDHNDPKFIETIPRRGYRFIADVSVIERAPSTAAPLPGAATIVAEPAYPPAARRLAMLPSLALPAVTAAAAAAVAIVLMTRESDGTAAGPRPVAAEAPLRFEQTAPPGTRIVSGGSLSPDRRYLAFVAQDRASGASAVWIRELASGSVARVDGTESAAQPFWAPDSRRIGFFAGGSLQTIRLGAESPETIARIGLNAAGGTWGPDDTIVYAVWSEGLYAIPADPGGAPTPILSLDRAADDIAISRPQFLTSGRHVLYHVASLDASRGGNYVADLDTRDRSRVLASETPALFAPPRHLLHVSGDMLIAEEFDPVGLEVTGPAMVVARGVSSASLLEYDFASAAGNLLAFQDGNRSRNLVWFDRSGKAAGRIATPAVLYNPRVSPDGATLLATSSITSDPGLWVASLEREAYSRVEKDAIAPLWSPDGRRLAFTSRGGTDLVVRELDSPESRHLLVRDAAAKILNDWTPSGQSIVYTRPGSANRLDLWIVDIDTGAERPLIAGVHNEMQARVSPDGEWIAYAADESGVLEVYVDRFPSLGSRRRVSDAGGGQPQWRADQRELYYISADRELMAVDVTKQSGEMTVFGAPRALFSAPLTSDPANARDHYVADDDGERFLFDSALPFGDEATITVVANWIDAGDANHPGSEGAYDAR